MTTVPYRGAVKPLMTTFDGSTSTLKLSRSTGPEPIGRSADPHDPKAKPHRPRASPQTKTPASAGVFASADLTSALALASVEPQACQTQREQREGCRLGHRRRWRWRRWRRWRARGEIELHAHGHGRVVDGPGGHADSDREASGNCRAGALLIAGHEREKETRVGIETAVSHHRFHER